jgi:putative DNA primase/helicase
VKKDCVVGIKAEVVVHKLEKMDVMGNGLFTDYDDLAAAQLFTKTYMDSFCFVPERRSWFYYDGTRWSQDSDSVAVRYAAQVLAAALQSYADEHCGDDPSQRERAFLKFVRRMADYGSRKRMIEDAEPHCAVKAERFDRDSDKLNMLNGTLDLKEMTLLPHAHKDFISKRCEAVYDPDARSELWENFLNTIFQGDEEKIRFVQKIFGYSMLGVPVEERAFIFYGKTSRNGKSSLCETIGAVVGDYSCTISPETLAQRERNARSASPDLARLQGVRLVRCAEPPKKMLLDCATLKTLTGRDRITARPLYSENIEFTPQFALVVNTNSLPSVNDLTIFQSDRLQVVSFDKHFNDSERDKTLKDRLLKPENKSAVLNWILDGIQRYRKEGLRAPESVATATQEYKELSDHLGLFLRECITHQDGALTPASDIYTRYQQWSDAAGYYCTGKQQFFSDLRDRNLLSAQVKRGGKVFHNIVKDYSLTLQVPEEFLGY